MRLFETLYSNHIEKKDKIRISITGGGGKTTILENLGSYLRKKDLSVLVTTTVKLANPLFHDYLTDYVYTKEKDVLSHKVKKGESVFYAETTQMDIKKAVAPRPEVLSVLLELYDVVIAEADGSRGLPIKWHTERDPVILDENDLLIAVMGLDAVFEKSCSVAFGEESETIVDKRYLARYFSDPEGLMKKKETSSDSLIIFNKAEKASSLAIDEVLQAQPPCRSYFASAKRDEIIREVL